MNSRLVLGMQMIGCGGTCAPVLCTFSDLPNWEKMPRPFGVIENNVGNTMRNVQRESEKFAAKMEIKLMQDDIKNPIAQDFLEMKVGAPYGTYIMVPV